MTETQATTLAPTPVFPPGRYGRRRESRRYPRLLPALLGVAVAIAGLAVALRLYEQYGDQTYDATVTRIMDIGDTSVRVEFTVTVPPGGTATCTVRARSNSGDEVGLELVDVQAAAGQKRVTVVHQLATTGRPRAVDVPGCGPKG